MDTALYARFITMQKQIRASMCQTVPLSLLFIPSDSPSTFILLKMHKRRWHVHGFTCNGIFQGGHAAIVFTCNSNVGTKMIIKQLTHNKYKSVCFICQICTRTLGKITMEFIISIVKPTDTAICLLAGRHQYLFDKCLLLYVQS